MNALGNLTRWPRHFLGRPRQSPSSHDEVRALSTVLTASKPARALHRGPPPPPTALCLDPKHSKIAPLEGERGVGWGNLGNFPGRAEIPRAPARVPFWCVAAGVSGHSTAFALVFRNRDKPARFPWQSSAKPVPRGMG